MGRRNVSVTNHPSCNFHMRNGITPVVPLRAAGVNVAMGLDDKTINDDEDAMMELRMMHKVHRLHTFDLATPALRVPIGAERDPHTTYFAGNSNAFLTFGVGYRLSAETQWASQSKPISSSAMRIRSGRGPLQGMDQLPGGTPAARSSASCAASTPRSVT